MSWLSRLLGVRSVTRRAIFAFHDGRGQRYADPMKVLAALDSRGDWQALVQAAVTSAAVDTAQLSPSLARQVGDKPKLMADLAKVVQDVFEVHSLWTPPGGNGPAGLTDLECVGVLTDFLTWCAKLGADYRPLASLPARPADSTSSEDTGEWSDSTSTATLSAA